MNLKSDQVPLAFFKALSSNQFEVVWKLLTQRSQEGFAELYSRTSLQNNPQAVLDSFSKNTDFSREYWSVFRENIQLDVWLRQSYQQISQQENQAMIKTQPANVYLLVYKESEEWKFGYIETFMDNH